METPPRSKLSLARTPKIYTPNSSKVRINLIKAVGDAIYGSDLSSPFVAHYAAEHDVLQASPESLYKKLYADFKSLIAEDFADLGITPELLAQYKKDAAVSVKLGASPYKKLPPASTPIKKIGEKVAKRFGHTQLSFRRTKEKLEACCADDVIPVNEDVLKATDSPEEIAWVLAHEVTHYNNGDQKEDIAYKLACESLSPNPERTKTHKRLCYTHEVFADVKPALASKRLAKGYKKRTESYLSDAGEDSEESDEHPSDSKRHKIAIATVELHKQCDKENIRATKQV